MERVTMEIQQINKRAHVQQEICQKRGMPAKKLPDLCKLFRLLILCNKSRDHSEFSTNHFNLGQAWMAMSVVFGQMLLCQVITDLKSSLAE